MLGWLPGVNGSQAALWWWSLWSFVVFGLGLRQPGVVGQGRFFGTVCSGCVVIYLIHAGQYGGHAARWLTASTITLIAAALIVERGAWGAIRWVRHAVMVCAIVQLPLMAWQACGGGLPWESLGGGLTGSVGRRSVLAALLGAASLWSRGGWRWVFAGASLLTGSFLGIPVMIRLLWKRWWLLYAFSAVLMAGMPWWYARVLDRVLVWKEVFIFRGGWLNGWGFLPLPGGFRYDAGPAGMVSQFVHSDYHNAFLDWISRTGMVGLGVLLWVGSWAACRSTTSSRRWSLMFAGWVGMWQSVEASPVLAMLLVVWWIILHEGAHDAVDSF